MFGETPSRILAGVLGCMALLPSAVSASHPHFGRGGHHHAGDGHHPSSARLGPAPTSAPDAGDDCDGAEPSAVSSAISSILAVASSSAVAHVYPSASASATVNTATSARVIIPFYVYPSAGAWTPMEELVSEFPDVEFTIIINPDSGPGSSSLPDASFLSAVPALTSHSNVLAIGYVPTQKGTRAIADVEKDVKTYAGWPSASGNSSFAVHGIFFDEAPNAYSADLVSYYQQLATLVKDSTGLGPENYVVTNPGTVPDAAYLDIPDSTVVFESPYDSFLSAISAGTFNSISTTNHSSLASMVYSVPDSVDLPTLITQVGNISEQIFLGNTSTYMAYDSYMNKVIPMLPTVAKSS
ncbi:hypothetical protein BO71DRAFT_390124 [Aspergillus ellipticus CBS 707.79]|uniref:Spherulin 4-like cell surface protein n=1 Tax=Aspergillus ellipticus CBS 707.79 TaxID=1448320 RepID=A0A319CVA4_9EURO|nr:hypothetical protein BO71DRAFT_390124 [Aspergillus ellipticus CBS 707.79]